jgi:hypothetical protein
MNQTEVVYCEGCRIPLTKKLLKELDGKNFCYFCYRKHAKKLNAQQEVKQNGISRN